ncbi:activator-dependent family glycosyltransferase [Amycolatopsis suaedae]|uniref:Activator-dependent family glycosyltransferase n=1 Tax=Amycolatopsis suaedae TaxID=2510978 RepID=A0A4Q7JGA0_9PSEU|nr:activator-dependent family glycosyltransferase [Amycolatopsis suaedae]RZQ66063.1 activator-dependent family glycosyltransferase [Amycolatopsis suaedae]
MRVLFTVFASSSHFTLLVPLAWALRSAGHEVRVASQPDLTGAINDAGLTAVPVGGDLDLADSIRDAKRPDGSWPEETYRFGETDPAKLTWDYVHATFGIYSGFVGEWFSNDEVIADLADFARFWKPDLVIWDALTFAGPLTARLCGAAHARMVFGVDYLAQMRSVFHRLAATQPEHLRTDPLAHWLGYKLRQHARPGEPTRFDEELLLGQASIDPMPPWIQLDTGIDYRTMHYVPYGGRSGFPSAALEPPRRPRVLLTLGLANRALGLPALPLAELLDGVAGLDVEVIATLDQGQIDSVAAIPDNVRPVPFVALDVVLPSCSAIVHHLGTGSTLAAIGCGVPQLCVRDTMLFWGEDVVAARLADRGAALVVDEREITAQLVHDSLHRIVTEPAFRASALRLQAEMRTFPSPVRLVPELEALAAAHSVTS